MQGKIISVNPGANFSLTQIVSQKLRLNPLSNLDAGGLSLEYPVHVTADVVRQIIAHIINNSGMNRW